MGLIGLLLLFAEPTVRALDVRGLQSGATTALTIDGDGLEGARLLLPFAAKATARAGATKSRVVFDVALGDVPAQFCNLRVVTDGGVSAPVAIAVDGLPQKPMAAECSLPVALHGALTSSTVVSTKFVGKAGEKVIIEAEAQRLGSTLRPVVHLYDARKKQLGWAWGKSSLGGDTRLFVTLPVEGEYTATLHDAEYAGGSPGQFRLKIGRWDFVEQVFPPVVDRARKSVELSTSLGTMKAELPLLWPKGGAWSGPRPFVLISEHAEIESKDGINPFSEGGASGRLKEGEEAKFRIAAKPGKLRLEVFAERLGSDLAASLVVRDDKGTPLARADEGPASVDPVLEYNVPPKTEAVNVGVLSTRGAGIYRLVVGEARGFRLSAKTGRVVLPVGGKCVVPVTIDRRGYEGAVELSAPGLKIEGTIPAGGEGALVTVHRTGDFAASLTRWTGKGGGREAVVSVAGDPLAKVQPWVAEEIAVSPSSVKSSDHGLDWKTAPDGIVPNKKLSLMVKAKRPAGTFVRLTLLTSQIVQPDANRLIRAERAVELDPKKDEGELPVIVPIDLPADSYDITVQADFLAADRRTVLASAYAPVRRVPVKMPLIVSAANVEAVKGKPTEIKGKVELREGLAGDVAVSVTGAPPGVGIPGANTKGGDFVLKFNIPPTLAPGSYPLKLSGRSSSGVKSRDAALVLIVR